MAATLSNDAQAALARGPISIRLGRNAIRIYYRPAEGVRAERWTVNRYVDGKRKPISFSNEKEAREKAIWILTRLNEGDAAGARMTGADQAQLLSARASVAPHGLDVPTACNLFAEAARLVGPHQVVAACQAYAKSAPASRTRLALADAVPAYLEAKRIKGRKKRTLENIASRLGIFEASHPGKALGDFTTAILQSWLDNLKLANGTNSSARSRINHGAMLGGFFEHYKRRGSIAENPCRALERESPRATGDIPYWTPAEAETLLHAMPAKVLPGFVLSLLCGLRSSEVEGLTWANINLAEAFAIVGDQFKTATRRLAPLPPCAVAWLTPHRGAPEAKVYPFKSDLCDQVTPAVKAANVRRPFNCARHTFVTYRAVLTGNVDQVAFEAGNRPKDIHESYRGLATKADAERFFNIFPKPSL